jgi:hypothetical protein
MRSVVLHDPFEEHYCHSLFGMFHKTYRTSAIFSKNAVTVGLMKFSNTLISNGIFQSSDMM